jgi:hypothetical protein
LTPRQTGRLTVGRNITLTLILDSEGSLSRQTVKCDYEARGIRKQNRRDGEIEQQLSSQSLEASIDRKD